MSATLTAPGLGLEMIAQQALLVLLEELNAEYQAVNVAWTPMDQALATALGETYVPVTIEPVPPGSFYKGHRPSLINAPPDKYPNCCTMCYRAVVNPADEGLDHFASFRVALALELMVKGTEEEGEGIVNARASRIADAAHNVITRNRTLRGMVTEIGDTPTAVLSDLFVRREKTVQGGKLLWQGARIEYAVPKVSRLDLGVGSQSGEHFLSAGSFDQAP